MFRTKKPLTINIEEELTPLNDIDTLLPSEIVKVCDFYKTFNITIKNPENNLINISLETLFDNIFNCLNDDSIGFYKFDNTFRFPLIYEEGIRTVPEEGDPFIKKLLKKNNVEHNPKPFINNICLMQHEFIFKYNNNIVVKQFLLPDISLVNEYNECYKYILNELCMQYYAYILNSLRPLSPNELENMVVIPKLFGIDIFNNISGCYISIYMEYVNRIENPVWVLETSNSDNDNGFDLWDPIIKNVFNYFEEHNLYHHDSGYRNVFWIDNNNKVKLAIIDYGEALLANNRTEIPIGQLTGYHSLSDKGHYLLWLRKRSVIDKYLTEDDHIYGGIKKYKTKKHKTKKQRKQRKLKKLKQTKKTKKPKTKKPKTKKSKTKKSKTKKSKTKKSYL